MKREEIEAFQQRVLPYLERQDDKDDLALVCRMAAAFADAIDHNVDLLADPEPDITRWMA